MLEGLAEDCAVEGGGGVVVCRDPICFIGFCAVSVVWWPTVLSFDCLVVVFWKLSSVHLFYLP